MIRKRELIVRMLAMAPNPEAIDLLVSVLRDSVHRVRAAAAAALAQCGWRPAAPADAAMRGAARSLFSSHDMRASRSMPAIDERLPRHTVLRVKDVAALPASFILATLLCACSGENAESNVTAPGGEESAETRMLEAGANIMQDKTPLNEETRRRPISVH